MPAMVGLFPFSVNDLPTRAEMYHDEATVITGNPIVVTLDSGQIDNFFARQSPAANLDTFQHSSFLRSGTYTLSVVGQTNSFNGKLDWYIDTVLVVSGQDWYSASQTKDVIKTATVTIANDGYQIVRGIVHLRNASSSGYNMDLTKYWLRQSTD